MNQTNDVLADAQAYAAKMQSDTAALKQSTDQLAEKFDRLADRFEKDFEPVEIDMSAANNKFLEESEEDLARSETQTDIILTV